MRIARFRSLARTRDRASGDPYLDTARLFRVRTASLQHRTGLPYGYDPARRPGAVVGGDWDLVHGTIEGSAYWIEFREALVGKRPWTETRAYAGLMEQAEAEDRQWRRRVLLKDVEFHTRGYEQLYASMCTQGCLAQRELSRQRGRAYRPANTDDISVAVGRTGELLLCQGGHRVETARALGIEEVPVWIGVRHVQWWEFRRTVVSHALRHGRLPERLCHPDFDTIPFAFDPGAVLPVVRRALVGESGLVVDASPGWGTMLHLLEDEGFPGVAFSVDADAHRLLERLREAGGKGFQVAGRPADVTVPEEGAAALLLRDAAARLAASDAREELLALLARVRPRHILIGGAGERNGSSGVAGSGGRDGAAGSRPHDDTKQAVRLLADTARLDRLEVLAAGAAGLVHLYRAPAAG